MAKTRILSETNEALARCIPAERTFKPPRGKSLIKERCLIEVVAVDTDEILEIRIPPGQTIRCERELFMRARNYAEQRE